MAFRILVQWRKHDRQDDLYIVANQIAEILIIPEV